MKYIETITDLEVGLIYPGNVARDFFAHYSTLYFEIKIAAGNYGFTRMVHKYNLQDTGLALQDSFLVKGMRIGIPRAKKFEEREAFRRQSAMQFYINNLFTLSIPLVGFRDRRIRFPMIPPLLLSGGKVNHIYLQTWPGLGTIKTAQVIQFELQGFLLQNSTVTT